MPDNEQETDLDNENELDDLEGSGTAITDADAPPATDNGDSESESKRINDLMSKWQASEAANAKLQAQLKNQKPQATGKNAEQGDTGEFQEFMRDHARTVLHSSDPRFVKYGLGADAIRGDSPAEMRASFEENRKLLDSLESKVRNEVMLEHGIDASVTSGRGASAPNIGTMSDDDFEKLLKKRSSF